MPRSAARLSPSGNMASSSVRLRMTTSEVSACESSSWLTLLALSAGAGAARADGLLYVGAGVSDNKLDDIGNSRLPHPTTPPGKRSSAPGRSGGSAVEGDYLDLGSHTDQFFGRHRLGALGRAGVRRLCGRLPAAADPVPGHLRQGGACALAAAPGHRFHLAPGDFFHYSDHGTDFAWGVGAQVHFGNVGARLEYESFNIANTSGAKVISLDAIVSLF